MEHGISLMAFAGGREATEVVRKLYIGLGVFRIIGVNPTKAETKALLGYEPEEEPEYTSIDKETGVAQVRINLVLETIPEKNNGIEWKTQVSLYLRNQTQVSKTGKIQVIDKYGNSQWLDPAVVQSGIAPTGAKLFGTFRPAFSGEVTLTEIMKAYINIPELMAYNQVTKEWYKGSNDPVECEANFEDVSKFFTGNVSELKQALTLQPNNSFKLLVGVKTTDQGKMYQDFYINRPMKLSSNSTNQIEKDLAADEQAGRHPNTEYQVVELKEYTVTPTDTSAPATVNTPWANTGGSPF